MGVIRYLCHWHSIYLFDRKGEYVMLKKSFVALLLVGSIFAATISVYAAPSTEITGLHFGTHNFGRITRSVKSFQPNAGNSGLLIQSEDTTKTSNFAHGIAETAGLPAEVVAKIEEINTGKDIGDILGNTALKGYKPMTRTNAVITKDANGGEQTTAYWVILTVPNLVDGMIPVIVFYNNLTGKWETITPYKEHIDYSKKIVRVQLPCCGTMALVSK